MGNNKPDRWIRQGVAQNGKSDRNDGKQLFWQLYMGLLIIAVSSGKLNANDQPQHLFILSGQSNMTRGLATGFRQVIEAHYGKENVTVVYHSKSGRGIRFWDKDYEFPKNYLIPGKEKPPSDRTRKQHGEVYQPLIEKIRDACQGKSHDTVTLIWMQGESDGMRGLAAVYAESFLRLLGRLKTDLDRKEMGFVIGRINNSKTTGSSAKHWRQMREVQVKLAKEADGGEWIDTDDFSAPGHGVHFPQDKYPLLGSRFAKKAIDLISKNAAEAAKGKQGENQ